MRLGLLDVVANLQALRTAATATAASASTATSAVVGALNAQHRDRWPDFYYDLSNKHTDHLEIPFWLPGLELLVSQQVDSGEVQQQSQGQRCSQDEDLVQRQGRQDRVCGRGQDQERGQRLVDCFDAIAKGLAGLLAGQPFLRELPRSAQVPAGTPGTQTYDLLPSSCRGGYTIVLDPDALRQPQHAAPERRCVVPLGFKKNEVGIPVLMSHDM